MFLTLYKLQRKGVLDPDTTETGEYDPSFLAREFIFGDGVEDLDLDLDLNDLCCPDLLKCCIFLRVGYCDDLFGHADFLGYSLTS